MLKQKYFIKNKLLTHFLSVFLLFYATEACSLIKNNNALQKPQTPQRYNLSKEAGYLNLTVNPFLWRAAIIKLNFISLKTIDPISGLLITNWYNSENSVNERIKITVYILDSKLRPDALKVVIHKQQYDGIKWLDVSVNPLTITALEDAILEQARRIYLAG